MTHPKLVEAMSRPDFYPHRPPSVQLVQTHISFVFIAGDRVYKVKKAVDFGFLDFTTLDKRKHFCEEELRLNRRLAPDAYLEVAAIGEGAGGTPVLGGGRPVEYAVVMRKLPPERMLKRLLAEGKAGTETMDAIAAKVADFHRRAETGGRIDATGGIGTIRRNHDENFEQTARYIGLTIPRERYDFLRGWVNRFLERERPLFEKRVADHRIRDCHGDLHAEHICLADGIVIFDCIEFNERFRFGDVAAEAAFLAMDLDYNGYPDHARAFVEAYVRHSGDEEVRRLLDFYRCYYAYVRGKVTSFRLDDAHIGSADREAAARTASRYFDLAFAYAARPAGKTLILVAGLMGTGKSVFARALAPLIGAPVVQTDAVRKEMLRIPTSEHRYEAFGEGIYSADISRRTYARALEIALEKLRTADAVILDGSYKSREERSRAFEAARRAGAAAILVECTCPEAVVEARLRARESAGGDVSDGRWEIFQAQKGDFERIDEIPGESHLVVDTTGEAEKSAVEVLERLSRPG
ncbi:MAG TPA: AAA family ATPase [Syntrophales bacterium]|nr:AAA family ATPase [Syntrophales bacterium]